jgi:hypothetical protein
MPTTEVTATFEIEAPAGRLMVVRYNGVVIGWAALNSSGTGTATVTIPSGSGTLDVLLPEATPGDIEMQAYPGPSVAVGDLVRVTVHFRNNEGVLTDPTLVIAEYETPAGVETTLTYGVDAGLVKVSTGVYYVDINITAAGQWDYRFAGTGAVQRAYEDYVIARPTEF